MWLDLANRAVARLNMKLILDFEEGTNTARTARLMLPSAIGEMLNMRPWKSATKAVRLSAVTDGGEPVVTADGMCVFALPEDYVRLVSKSSGQRRGRSIVDKSSADVTVIYVAIPEDPSVLDPLLQSTIVCMLAYKMSLALTSDQTLTATLYQEAQNAITMACLQEDQGEEDELPAFNSLSEVY